MTTRTVSIKVNSEWTVTGLLKLCKVTRLIGNATSSRGIGRFHVETLRRAGGAASATRMGKRKPGVEIKRTMDGNGRTSERQGQRGAVAGEGGKIRERVVKRERRAHRNANATDPIKLHWVIERENTTYKRGAPAKIRFL